MEIYLNRQHGICPDTVEVFRAAIEEIYGNPSSTHMEGQKAAALLTRARQKTAACIGVSPKEITFTSSEEESTAQLCISACDSGKGKRIVTDEDSPVFHTAKENGFEVIVTDYAEEAVNGETCLVSVGDENRGRIRKLDELTLLCRQSGAYLHVRCSSFPFTGDVDMITLKSHVPGISAFYARKGIRLTALVLGGMQERGKRAGTENVPAAAAFSHELYLQTSMNRERLARRFCRATGIDRKDDEYIPGAVFRGMDTYRVFMDRGINISADGVMYIGEENTEEEIDYAADVYLAQKG